jgi:type I restriction enzyme, S subunit
MNRKVWPEETIESLISSGAIIQHKDGNYGSLYPKVEEFGSTGVPFLTAKSIVNGKLDIEGAPRLADDRADALRFGFVRPQDVLLSHNATIGRVAIVPDFDGRLLVGTSLTYFRLNAERMSARYFAAYLASVEFQNQLAAVMSHSTRNQVPITAQRKLSVVVPPLSTQHAVASIVGALDDKIEQNRRTLRALERLAQAIFRAWFVDFEPVKAKAAGATAFPSMPQPVFDALPTRFVDSDIGPLPQGWNVGAISDFATLSKTQVNPQERLEEAFDHFSIPAFDAGMRPVAEAGSAIKSIKFLVVEGCVLLSKLNPRTARVWLPPLPCGRRQIASTEFLVFVPVQTSERHYLYCQFQQTAFREELAQGASGTSNSHQRLRPEDVLKRAVALPPTPTRETFAGIADPLYALVAANHDESAKLANMRDYLLPKLLSGKVCVRAAERLIGAAA